MAAWRFIRQVLIPFLFLTVIPLTMIFISWFSTKPPRTFDYSNVIGNPTSWLVAFIMIAWAFTWLKVSSKDYDGPPTKFGFIPRYKSNGSEYFVGTSIAYLMMCFTWPEVPLLVYRSIPQLIGTMNLVALIFCVYLWWQGKRYPQTGEKLATDLPAIFEFYRGMEIHPRIFGIDVKQLTNCRIGLMMWHLFVLNNWYVSYNELGWNCGMACASVLQMTYLFKFFAWETSYFNTLDMTLDRAGFYICWGCLVFLPGLYGLDAYWYVANPPRITEVTALVVLVIGIAAIPLTYLVDMERVYFRKTGKSFFTSKPRYVNCEYRDVDGNQRQSRLLASGFWSVSRHLNYVMELVVYYSWSIPGWHDGIIPFACALMLTVLLVHRTYRDEDKCKEKYGKAWDEYCKIVRYKMIPFVF